MPRRSLLRGPLYAVGSEGDGVDWERCSILSVRCVCISKKYSVALEWFSYSDSIQGVGETIFWVVADVDNRSVVQYTGIRYDDGAMDSVTKSTSPVCSRASSRALVGFNLKSCEDDDWSRKYGRFPSFGWLKSRADRDARAGVGRIGPLWIAVSLEF